MGLLSVSTARKGAIARTAVGLLSASMAGKNVSASGAGAPEFVSTTDRNAAAKTVVTLLLCACMAS